MSLLLLLLFLSVHYPCAFYKIFYVIPSFFTEYFVPPKLYSVKFFTFFSRNQPVGIMWPIFGSASTYSGVIHAIVGGVLFP